MVVSVQVEDLQNMFFIRLYTPSCCYTSVSRTLSINNLNTICYKLSSTYANSCLFMLLQDHLSPQLQKGSKIKKRCAIILFTIMYKILQTLLCIWHSDITEKLCTLNFKYTLSIQIYLYKFQSAFFLPFSKNFQH